MNIPEYEFEELYDIEPNHLVEEAPFGGMYETYGDELDYILKFHDDHPDRVWTVLDVDGKFYFTTGLHFVNRFGYLITKQRFNCEITVELPTEDLEL